ncbi:SinI family restriction endonuclease [Secundilactobacillus muriivasis]
MAKSKKIADYTNYNITQLLNEFDSVLSRSEFTAIFPDNSEIKANFRKLFEIALSDMNHLFPNLNVKATSTDPKDYITKWVNRYKSALQTPPSSRIAEISKSAVDPVLEIMVQEYQKLSKKEVEEESRVHQLFMSAENVQGNLLEEYIASVAEPQGWIWARGETLRACDFVKPQGTITSFVQIKNRDNTENSSSSAIREGTQIKKWNRLKTITRNKKPLPCFMWDKLNELMELEGVKTSEEDYEHFLREVVKVNPNVIINLVIKKQHLEFELTNFRCCL